MPENTTSTRVIILDVARRANVSTATVSRVINSTGPVAPETADRVWAAIKELNYVPHAGARTLRSNKTDTLGVIFPEIGGAFFSALIKGIEMCTTQNGYSLLIYSTQERKREKQDYYLPVGEHNTDGLIVFTDSLDDADLIQLHVHQFPMVLMHRSPPEGLKIPYVTFENKDGARAIVEHLIEVHNYRRIGFLAGPEEHEDAQWRERGYRDALAVHSIPYDPALVGQGSFDDKDAEASVQQWLVEGLEMDAIFAADDESATGALRALLRAGKAVPEDIAVVGFDDTLLSRHLTPPLTTVRAPIEKAGQSAAELLIDLIRKGQTEPFVLLPTELVIRRSCGCQTEE